MGPLSAFRNLSDLGKTSIRTGIVIELIPEANRTLDELMRRTGDNLTDLFRKAIGLYKLAEEAKRDGKAVGIATTPALSQKTPF